MTPEQAQHELSLYLQDQMQIWAQQYITGRVAYLRKRKIAASDELIRSMQYEVKAAATRDAVTTLLAFQDYGRYIDMKTLNPAAGGNVVLSIEDWIRRKGLEGKFIDTYMRKRKLRQVPDRVLTYIAWGIVRKRTTNVKRRAWYSKSKAAAVNELYNAVAAGLPETTLSQIKKSLQQ